jgi:DNA polymerase III epsilon subunit-like protein
MTYFLFFDIETTGLLKAKKYEVNYKKPEQFPNIVQISWQLQKYEDGTFTTVSDNDFIILPINYTIPDDSAKIHGITNKIALSKGVEANLVYKKFIMDLIANPDTYLVCHNIEFDVTILFYHIYKIYEDHFLSFKSRSIPCICTMLDSIEFCALPSAFKYPKAGSKNPNDLYKFPKLSELYVKLFGKQPDGTLHNSKFDVECTIQCFKELMKRKLLTVRNASITMS